MESEINAIIERSHHAVVSWVTKSHEPVSAVMLYVILDGLITVTSTTNRAKYHAWKRIRLLRSVSGIQTILVSRLRLEAK